MRNLLLVGLMLLYAAGALAAPNRGPQPTAPAGGHARPGVREAWRAFTSDEGRFTVLMPGQPRVEATTKGTPVGPVTKHVFSARSGSTETFVEYSDIPSMAFLLGSAGAIFDGAQKAFLEETHASLVSSSDVRWEGHRGREASFEVPSSAKRGRLRLYLVKHRLYGLAVWAPTSAARGAPPFDRFFESFQIQ